MVFATDFELTEKFLIVAYPEYQNEISNNHVWYTKCQKVRFGSLGDVDGKDLSKLKFMIGPKQNYWIPKREFHDHMKSTALEEMGRLKKVSEDERNPNFAKFPVKYDNALGDREINDAVRISSLDHRNITLEKATYLDQLSTNIMCDKVIKGQLNKTFRQIDRTESGGLREFKDCVQANTIGIASLFVDKDFVPLLGWREFTPEKHSIDSVQRRLGAMERGWHCFSSGVLKWQDVFENSNAAPTSDGILDGILSGMKREIKAETDIEFGDGHYSIAPYAFARELKRAGKPQFFFIVRFNKLSTKEIVELVNAGNPTENDEYGFTKAISFKAKKSRSVRKLSELPLSNFDDKRLIAMANNESGTDSFTYECFASLYFARHLYNRVRWLP